MDLARFSLTPDADELSLTCQKCWSTLDCPDDLSIHYTGTSLVSIMRLVSAHAARCPGPPDAHHPKGDLMATDTPLVIVQRINAHLANLEFPADGWAEAAENLADEYRRELAAMVQGHPYPTQEQHDAAVTAAIARWEYDLTHEDHR